MTKKIISIAIYFSLIPAKILPTNLDAWLSN